MSSRQVDIHPEAIAEAQAANRWYWERSASWAGEFNAMTNLWFALGLMVFVGLATGVGSAIFAW